MGGCVSSPKDLELEEGEQAPIESPNSPKNAEGETLVQETKEGGDKEETKEENKEEKVDALAETKEEAKVEQPKAEDKKDEPLVTL
ncbi:PREDICTED: probable methyltransferase PMT26 isoform X2 [Lupinus angustifolius]|uniref:probable methyltransferase PMT26 isoform X2 n=1 Tax=Lupinus angustifolius TaxID=3871 RepID=UPI00092FA039|nr:PREDICTED: probable methyltransferase PMT26 isoform X2 [Lupinus angustifolius]